MSLRPTGNANLRARSPHSPSEGPDRVQAGENENPIVSLTNQDRSPLLRKGTSFPIGLITRRVLCQGAPHGATPTLRMINLTHPQRS